MATIDIKTEVSLYKGTGPLKYDTEYDGSLMLTKHGAELFGDGTIEFFCVSSTSKEAVDTQIAILEGIIKDCQEHIKKLRNGKKIKKNRTNDAGRSNS